MLIYLIKSSAILAILLLFYKVFLERTHIHTIKRYYLLLSLVIAIAIPFITFTSYQKVTTVLPINLSNTVLLTEGSSEINYIKINLWIIYAIGTLIFTIRFIANLKRILALINNSEKIRNNGFVYVLLNGLVVPHTFFNYIFFNREKYATKSIPKEVELHEQTHAAQFHSLDILLIELLQVAFWFNPVVYILKHDIKLNHEFIADSVVLKSGTSLKNYLQILLDYSKNFTVSPIANAINYSLIKKRFLIMKTKTSKKTIWLRNLILLPLFAGLIYSFGERRLIQVPIKGEDISADSIIKGLSNPSELTYITVKVTKDKIVLNDSKVTNLSGLPNALKEIINNSGNKSFADFGAIIEASDVEMGRIIDIRSKLAEAGIPYSKLVLHDKKAKQKGATPEQLGEYNKLAKKYNAMSRDKMVIKSQDIKRIKYIYDLMTEQQRKNAEPFPNFPPPPTIPAKIHKTKLPEARTDTVPPPPPPPTPDMGTIEKGSAKLQEAYKKYKKSAHDYTQLIKEHSNTTKGYSKLSEKYEEVMKFYNNFKSLAEKENIITPPPPPPAEKSEDKKTGFLEVNGKTIYYVKSGGNSRYYDRYGNEVDKGGNSIKPK